MKRLILSMCLLTSLMGIAHAETYKSKMNSWIGHGVEEMVNSWGYASQEMVSPNGNKVYLYERSSTYQQPVFQTPSVVAGMTVIHGAQLGGGTYTAYCNTWVEVDSKLLIVTIKWEGNSCQ